MEESKNDSSFDFVRPRSGRIGGNMINIVSERNVLNGVIIDKNTTTKLIEDDKTRIYEVIRVINNKPVFLLEHYERLINSIKLSNLEANINYELFKNYIDLLISENAKNNLNEFSNCNIRVSFDLKEKHLLFMYFVKSFYPDKNYYETGIHTITIIKERENPNIKKNAKNYRDEIDLLLKENNAFEAILVNIDKTVSEGSKSNVFFVKENSLITAEDKDVLLGVTRSKVLEIAEKFNIDIVKRKINVDELYSFDAAFITGTSNNVLPIKTINNINLNSTTNEVVIKLMKEYEKLILE